MLIANQLIRNRFHGIVLDQGDATVDTNTVSGPVVRTDCEGLLAGITLLPGATGNIHDSTITDIRHDPLDSCQVGNGIVAGTVAGAVVTVTIANNTITGYQKTGIVLRGTGSTGTIAGNTVTGAGPIDLLAQNGIQVTGASATVSGNTVSGNECNVPSPTGCGADPLTQTQSAGIAFFPAASGSSMTGNTVTGNDVGLYNFALGPTTISGNTLTDNRFEGILLDEGDATVDSNMIDPGNIGIVVISFAESTGDSKGTLTCNGITAATQAGIRLIRDPDSGFTVALTAHSNSIAGNAAGVDNRTAVPVDATQNWWGCTLGPNNPGCDTVNNPVTVDPPFVALPPCVPTTTTTTEPRPPPPPRCTASDHHDHHRAPRHHHNHVCAATTTTTTAAPPTTTTTSAPATTTTTTAATPHHDHDLHLPADHHVAAPVHLGCIVR